MTPFQRRGQVFSRDESAYNEHASVGLAFSVFVTNNSNFSRLQYHVEVFNTADVSLIAAICRGSPRRGKYTGDQVAIYDKIHPFLSGPTEFLFPRVVVAHYWGEGPLE